MKNKNLMSTTFIILISKVQSGQLNKYLLICFSTCLNEGFKEMKSPSDVLQRSYTLDSEKLSINQWTIEIQNITFNPSKTRKRLYNEGLRSMRLNKGSKCILFNKSLAKFETSYLKESYGINLTGILENTWWKLCYSSKVSCLLSTKTHNVFVSYNFYWFEDLHKMFSKHR